jgi:phospholipase D-like protein
MIGESMMTLPFSIDNQTITAADVLNALLARCRGCPVDIASAYFTISGWRLLRDGLHHVGAMRLLLGSEPAATRLSSSKCGADVGLRADMSLAAELSGMAFSEETLRLVEDLVAFLRAEKVQVRLFQDGFLHAKAYLLHQDRVGPTNYEDRLRPFAAVVGSSNFTGPGLTSNKELNLVHRVFTEEDEPVDADAARHVEYLAEGSGLRVQGSGNAKEGGIASSSCLNPEPRTLNPDLRRSIKSEVGARAVMELEQWFQRNWQTSADFKQQMIDLLNQSKFGQFEYPPRCEKEMPST